MPDAISTFDTGVKMLSLADYHSAPPQEKDDNVLILGPALERRGTLLLIAPSGIGKSVWSVQAAPMFGAGIKFSGLTPSRPINIWTIQFEDSDRRLAVDRDDITNHLKMEHPEIDWDQVIATTMFPRFPPVKGAEFIRTLDEELGNAMAAGHLPDAVCINNIFSIVNGDISSSTVCSSFLRGGNLDGQSTIGLQGILTKYNIGAILVHHTGKPPTSPRELANWINSPNPEYLGCGSCELVNFGRTCLSMMKIPNHDGIIKITAGKNGDGLEWEHGIHLLAYGEGLSCTGHGSAHYFRELRLDEIPTDRELGILSSSKKPGPRRNGNPAEDATHLADIARSNPALQKDLREAAVEKFGNEQGLRAFKYFTEHLNELKLFILPCGINNAQMIGANPEAIKASINKYRQQMKDLRLNKRDSSQVHRRSENTQIPNSNKTNE